MLIKGMAIIFGCLLAGEVVAVFLPLPLPGNILGMALLFLLLLSGRVALKDVEEAGDLLLEHLAFLFIPVAVGIMQYGELMIEELLSFLVLGAGGFLVLFVVSGKVIDLLVAVRSRAGGGVDDADGPGG